MKYLLEADVDGETSLQETTSFKHREREYIFHRGDRGFLAKISIVAPAPDPSRFYTEFRTSENPSITLSFDRGLRTELLSDLQQIEGLLASPFRVSRVAGTLRGQNPWLKLRKSEALERILFKARALYLTGEQAN